MFPAQRPANGSLHLGPDTKHCKRIKRTVLTFVKRAYRFKQANHSFLNQIFFIRTDQKKMICDLAHLTLIFCSKYSITSALPCRICATNSSSVYFAYSFRSNAILHLSPTLQTPLADDLKPKHAGRDPKHLRNQSDLSSESKQSYRSALLLTGSHHRLHFQ